MSQTVTVFDSNLATTREFWRRKVGLSEEIATDPRPLAEIAAEMAKPPSPPPRRTQTMTDERKDGGPAYPVWRPIETAPRDTIILGYGEMAGEMSGQYHEKHIFPIIFSGDGDYEGFAWSIPSTDYAAMWMNPTHWMHQPPPPGSLSPIKESDTAIIAKLREALERIAEATPRSTNSFSAHEAFAFCAAVAETALDREDAIAKAEGTEAER